MMDLKDLAAGSYRWPEALRIFGSLQNQAPSYCFVLCFLTDINKQIATGVTGATVFFFVLFLHAGATEHGGHLWRCDDFFTSVWMVQSPGIVSAAVGL